MYITHNVNEFYYKIYVNNTTVTLIASLSQLWKCKDHGGKMRCKISLYYHCDGGILIFKGGEWWIVGIR